MNVRDVVLKGVRETIEGVMAERRLTRSAAAAVVFRERPELHRLLMASSNPGRMVAASPPAPDPRTAAPRRLSPAASLDPRPRTVYLCCPALRLRIDRAVG